MKILNLTQGSYEWLATRLTHFTASEAPIMMGASSHMSRDELLTYKTTQIAEEVSFFQQKIFDHGHNVEVKYRPIAEKKLDTELFPITGAIEQDGMRLLASFDGLDMFEEQAFEHKQWNSAKAQEMANLNDLLPEYYWQCEHQLLVSGASTVLFVMSDGTDDCAFSTFYASKPERRKALIAGWKQFQKDLEGYEPKEYAPEPEGSAPESLPALFIDLQGEVTNTNIELYKSTALQFIESINTDLQTDEDFATAEKTIKFCSDAEDELEAVKKQALAKTADISALFNTVDDLKEAVRVKRLELNKLVKAKKENIRQLIVLERREAFAKHISTLNEELKIVRLPDMFPDFAAAIRGKKTVKSLEESANDALANAKTQATITAQEYAENLETFEELAGEHRFLFNDLQTIVDKDADHFEMLVKSRIAEHEKAEADRLEAERERIREEEASKLAAKQEEPEPEPEEPQKTITAGRAVRRSSEMSIAESDIKTFLVEGLGVPKIHATKVAKALCAGEVPHCSMAGEAKAA